MLGDVTLEPPVCLIGEAFRLFDRPQKLGIIMSCSQATAMFQLAGGGCEIFP